MARLFPLVFVGAIVCAQAPLKFMGRAVTVTESGYEDSERMFPKGPASVCGEGTPQQCYTAPGRFGRHPEVSIVQVDKATPAIFFSAASGGTSGWQIHFALLRPGPGKEFENLFPSQLTLSSQSQHAFWTDPSISGAAIFVTADYVWGPGECHLCPHRYIISAYTWQSGEPLIAEWGYHLQDQYMTVRTYGDAEASILESEKQEIIARLRRVKQSAPH